MSFTFTLTGNSSNLQSDFFPVIPLEGNWEIGLLNLESFNSIPNLSKGGVKIGTLEVTEIMPLSGVVKTSKNINDNENIVTNKNFENNHVVETEIKIPTGSYELEDISNLINSKYGHNIINFRGNRNTLKTEVTVSGINRFITVNKELGDLLGVNRTLTFYSGEKVVLENPTNISRVNVIRINCNVAQSSYLNGKPTHTIHEFFPNVPPGFRILETPNTVIYHSINTSRIDRINLDLVDQNDRTVDFRGETITIRLHLRERQ